MSPRLGFWETDLHHEKGGRISQILSEAVEKVTNFIGERGRVPMQDVQMQDVQMQDVPMQDVPMQDVPMQDVPMQDVPMQDVPMQDVPMQDVPMQDVPMQDVPMQDVPMQDVPMQDVPMQDVPMQDVPMQDVPMQDILNYDFNVTNMLFEGNFTPKPDKQTRLMHGEKLAGKRLSISTKFPIEDRTCYRFHVSHKKDQFNESMRF